MDPEHGMGNILGNWHPTNNISTCNFNNDDYRNINNDDYRNTNCN